MLVTLLGLCVAALSAPDEGSYHKLFPHPTGQNGYEDYVMAGDLLTSPRAEMLLNWTPHQYAGMLEHIQSLKAQGEPPEPNLNQATLEFAASLTNKTQLEVWQLEEKELGRALVYIQNGNMKPIEDPRQDLTSNTLFLESRGFKRIAQFAKQVSFVDFANGRSSDGLAPVTAAFIQANRTNQRTMICMLVGAASQSTLFGAMDQTRLSWSMANAKQVESLCDQLLAQPTPMRTVMQGEYAFALSAVKDVFRAGASGQQAELGEHDDHALRAISLLQGEQRDQFVQLYAGQVKAQYEEIIRRFEGDEARWIEPIEDKPVSAPSGTSLQELAEHLADLVQPTFSQVGVVLARQRTQVRLLRLHAKITQYRWGTGRLPKTLAEVATPTELHDPFSKSAFQYELNETGGYRLYSMGFKGSRGEIDLAYKPTLGEEQEARP